MWLILAFSTTGFLVGTLMAMSASSTVPSFLGLLFALLGGSLIAFLHKLDHADRILAGKLVLSLSSMCLLGIIAGLFVTERQLLTPRDRRFLSPGTRVAAAAPCAFSEVGDGKAGEVSDLGRSKYLAARAISEADLIDDMKRTRALTADEAYDKLRAVVQGHCGEPAR